MKINYNFTKGSISWKYMINLVYREQARLDLNLAPQTRVTKDAVLGLDAYSRMRMHFAKVVTADETFVEGCLHYENMTHCVPYTGDRETCSLEDQLNYYESLNQDTWPKNKKEINPLPTLRYMLMINSLFNSLFLNMSENINLDNIDSIEIKCRTILENYFGKWRDQSLASSTPSSFIPLVTYHNLRLSTKGALTASRLAFQALAKIKKINENPSLSFYITMNKFNESNVELLFGKTRNNMHGKSNHQTYIKAVGASSVHYSHNSRVSTDELNKSNSYDSQDVHGNNPSKSTVNSINPHLKSHNQVII